MNRLKEWFMRDGEVRGYAYSLFIFFGGGPDLSRPKAMKTGIAFLKSRGAARSG